MAGEDASPLTKIVVAIVVVVVRRWRARKHGRHERPDGRHSEPED
jgi:hypothetical protein